MIAPLRETQTSASKRSLLRARMAVASAMLPPKPSDDASATLPQWRAWIWTSWIVLVTVVFIARLLVPLISSP